MVLELVFGFVVLVAASYVGTTMALRGFFGRERYSPPVEPGSGGSADEALSENDGASPENDDVPRANDAKEDAEDR